MAITAIKPPTLQPITIGANDAGTPKPLPTMPNSTIAPTVSPTMPTVSPTTASPFPTMGMTSTPNTNSYAGYQYNGSDPRGMQSDGSSGNFGDWAGGSPTGTNDPRTMQNDGISGNFAEWARGGGTSSNASPFAPMQPQTGITPAAGTSSTAPMPTAPSYQQPVSPAIAPQAPSYAVNQNTNIGNVNGIDAVRVNPTQLSGMQPFIDAAYNQSVSRLDPQFAEGDRAFRQQMVNQGLQEGTEAYDNARANFDRNRNDAYASARNNAMGQGLAAQGQAWNQGAQQTGLAQGMRQWNDQYRLNQDNADLGAYSTLTGLDMAGYGLNQNAQQQQFNNTQSLLGMIPGMSPNAVDVNGIYGLNQSAGQFNAQQNANANNGMWNAIGTAASAYFACSHDYKNTIEPIDVDIALNAMCKMPVDMWKYKEGEDVDTHLSTYAEEFHEYLGLPARREISLIDMMGAVHASIQALAARLDKAGI